MYVSPEDGSVLWLTSSAEERTGGWTGRSELQEDTARSPEGVQATGGALRTVGVQAGGLGGLPVLLGVIADVDGLPGGHSQRREGGGEDAGIGFVHARLAGDYDGLEIAQRSQGTRSTG